MNVDIKLDHSLREPCVLIRCPALTPEIQKLAAMVESFGSTIPSDPILTVQEEDKIIVLHPQEISMIRVEDGVCLLYGKGKAYRSKRRLYEWSEQLGDLFMQISKTTLVNVKHLDSVEPSFNGMMLLKLKNGSKDYISRKYLPEFKKYLGI